VPDVTYGNMEFASKLKRLMGEHRYSQESLARRLDVSQGLVSKWTRGLGLPDLREGKVLADLFGVSVDFLADDRIDSPVPATDRERAIWEIVRAIGPDRAFLRLMEEDDAPPRVMSSAPATPPKLRGNEAS
jgi:transcriptional regulator with XRE-family HTH domain